MSDQEDILTPYQGKHRCFGFFECEDCNNGWASAHSWANTSQQCSFCLIDVYPHIQRPLLRRKNKKKDVEKAHRGDLCGKCEELGTPCNAVADSKVPHTKVEQQGGRRRRRRRRRQGNNEGN